MSNLQDWEASLGTTDETSSEGKPLLRKMRSRTKSADLTNMRKAANEINASSTSVNYHSDHGRSEGSNIKERGDTSDTSESLEDDRGLKEKQDKPVAKLRRTLSERFRRENRIAPPDTLPVDDSIHKAIRQGINSKQATKLFRKMTHVDQTDSKGQSCLHLCASRGDNEISKILLKKGANINLKDSRGFTPLHCGALERKLHSLIFLLGYKTIDVNATNRESSNVLHYFVRIPVTEDNVVLYRLVLDTLIVKGIEINAQNSHGEAPIHFACMTSNIHSVAFLLERGADTNLQTQ